MEKSHTPTDVQTVEQELHGVEAELHQFEERQLGETRALQMIVYPALVVFLILAVYGFYLIQSLTTDMHLLTDGVNQNMKIIANNMQNMNERMTAMADSTLHMSHNVSTMNDSTQYMAGNIQQMNASTQNMAASAYNMQRDMWSMNKNISGPMKMFNTFTPFGKDNTQPYVVPPPMVTPYYPPAVYGTPSPTMPSVPAAAATNTTPAVTNTPTETTPPTIQNAPAPTESTAVSDTHSAAPPQTGYILTPSQSG